MIIDGNLTFCSDCESYFGKESIKPISSDDSVICDTSVSKIVPLENGEVSINERYGFGINQIRAVIRL